MFNNVIIYGKPSCVFCEAAKQLCMNHGISYVYKDVSETTNLDELRLTLPNIKTVPQVFTEDGLHLGGFSEFKQLTEESTDRRKQLNG